jgi:TonB-linked SusC/RagA family outer membrane protein
LVIFKTNQMKKIIYSLLFLIFTVSFNKAFSQSEQIITGTVIDNVGPVPAASVYEKDFTSNGSNTDEQGRFTLKLKGTKRIVVIRSIGYLTREVDFSGKKNMSITLSEDAKGLEEVVVLGIGQVAKKVTNTGATSTITGAQIRQSPSASLQNSLAGRLPGFFSEQRSGQPGKDGAAFQIRGINSYAGGTSPLIIVDDVEYTLDQVNQLDPNEIESITILKDASTTAVYGVRGSNGVLIVRTRRGISGSPELNFRIETGLQLPTQRPEVNDGFTTLSLYREKLTNQYLGTTVTPETGDYAKFYANNALMHYKLNDDPYTYPNVQWWDEVMRKVSLQSRINFDISGGTNTAKYFINLGYLSQGGLFKDFSKDQGYESNYTYNRYTFRSNVDLAPTKTLKIRIDLSGRFGVTNEPNDKPWNNGGTTFQYLWNGELNSFSYPIYWSNGLIASSTNPSAIKPNPVANLMYAGYNRSYNNNLNMVTEVNQQLDFITRGLAVNGMISYATDYNFGTSLTRNASEILAYNYNPVTKAYDPVVSNLYRMGVMTRGSSSAPMSKNLGLRFNLNYARSFGDHNITALVLATQSSFNKDANGNIVSEPFNIRGLTAKVTYNYKQKYLVDFSGGYNGSDRFVSDKKYQLFPAIGVGWNISEEPFFKDNISFINLLKIRGSYGLTGNDNIGTSTYIYVKSYSNPSGASYVFGETPVGYSGIAEPTLGNSNITWMVTRDANIGMELKMFQGSLSMELDFFKKKTKNIFTIPGSIPSTFGASLPPYNLGTQDNKGFEVNLTYNARITSDFSVFANTNLSYAKNKVTYRNEPAYPYPWLAQTGQTANPLFAYTAEGFYQTLDELYNAPKMVTAIPLKSLFLGSVKLKDLNGDGIIDANDRGYIGTNYPFYTAGFSFGFSYKGFDVSNVFQGSFGNFLNMNRGSIGYGRPERVSVPLNAARWTPITGNDAMFPDLSGNAQNTIESTYWYKKGDYIRWKNFVLGYRFPSSVYKRLRLNSLRVYANGYNMGLLHTYLPASIDPESVATSAAGEYPQQRVFNFGIQFGL